MADAVSKTQLLQTARSRVAEITPELADTLYEATNGDIEFNMCDGVAFLEFERSARSLREAITSAIREVEAGMPLLSLLDGNLPPGSLSTGLL